MFVLYDDRKEVSDSMVNNVETSLLKVGKKDRITIETYQTGSVTRKK